MTQVINRGSSYKPRKKRKYASAEAARQARELEASWNEVQSKWAPTKPVQQASTSWSYSLSAPAGRETTKLPSRGDGIGVAVAKPQQTYTGDKMLGIGTLHKSNSIPVFKEEEAKDLASMRR